MVTLCLSGIADAAAQTDDDAVRRPWDFVPFVRKNPCLSRYRQLAVSPPLQGTSDGGEGFPWRALYGYCVAQTGRMLLHQDWVVSYLDAEPQGSNPGGNGASLGTDVSLQWPAPEKASLAPYVEIGGGIQYALGTAFPAHGSRFNFTINAGAGVLIPSRAGRTLNVAIRYLHISNAGVSSDNAGYDAFHLVVGVRW